MAIKLKRLMFSAMFLVATAAPQAQATPAVCGRIAGATIFADLLYGMAAGGLLSGLFMAADDNFNRSDNKLAYGALAGSTIGIGVGLAEVFSAKCVSQTESGAARSETARLRLFAAPAGKSSVAGLNFSLAI
jgi:ABC-type Mn2+/Zn2+ transport system permease subunit